MSSIKNPRERKRLSLARDRRNTYGENDKSSRKNIPRAKQRRHMDERRKVAEVLRGLNGQVPDDQATEAELRTKTQATLSQQNGFRKSPDTPLGVVLAKQAKSQSKLTPVVRKP